MTDTKTIFKTVQEGRWAVRRPLTAGYKQIREAGFLPPRVEVLDFYGRPRNGGRFVEDQPLGQALNKTLDVRKVLAGVEGLDKDAQVARLTEARGLVDQARTLLTEVIAGADEPLQALLTEVRDGKWAEAADADCGTTALARDRDFEAHQAAKAAAKAAAYEASGFDDEYDDDEDDDDED